MTALANHTQNLILETFANMLEQMPFEKITVTALIRECNIGRNTFYYHYEDIYALLDDTLSRSIGKYENAVQNEDWKSVIHYASEVIAIQPNEDLSKIIERAKQKISIQEKDIEYQREINRVNALLSTGDVDEANIILNRLQKEYPEHIKEIKELRKRAFAWGNPTPSKKENPQRPPIGFTAPPTNTEPKDAGSFFEDDTPQKKPNVPASKPKPNQPKEKPPKNTGIDFFDMDFNPKT